MLAEPPLPPDPLPQPVPEEGNPFKRLLKMSKFWLAMCALLTTVLTVYFKVDPLVIVAINGVFAVVIHAIATEDAAEKSAKAVRE